MYRITIRATQETVPQSLVKQMEQKLAQGTKDDVYSPWCEVEARVHSSFSGSFSCISFYNTSNSDSSLLRLLSAYIPHTRCIPISISISIQLCIICFWLIPHVLLVYVFIHLLPIIPSTYGLDILHSKSPLIVLKMHIQTYNLCKS